VSDTVRLSFRHPAGLSWGAVTADKYTKWTLGVDVTFCLVGGLVLILGGVFMADAVGVSGWIISGIGIVVEFVWAIVIALAGSRKHVRQSELERIIGGKLIWLIGTLVVLAIPGSMSSTGKIALAAVGAFVALLTAAQLVGRKRLIEVGFGAHGTDQAGQKRIRRN